MDGLKPYPAYRDSDVPWLGQVPTHWDVRRLKSCVANVNQQASFAHGSDVYIALEHVESWTGRVRLPRERVLFDSQVKCFEPDDVLFGKLRPYLAKVARMRTTGVCVGEFLVLRPRESRLLPSFLDQLLRSAPLIAEVNSGTFGAKMPRADWDIVGSLCPAFPPSTEQAAIARFLDYVDRRIRRYIAAKKKLVALLNEEKQAIINRAVTRGLDPDVRLKPSGIDWLGDVPEHWDVMPLRLRYLVQLGKMLDSKRITGNHLIPYLRNVDVQWDRVNTMALPTMDIRPEEYGRYTLNKADLLVCEGGEVGRAALWNDSDCVVGFQKALHRLRPIRPEQDEPRFMLFLLRDTAARGVFLADGNENTIAHLTGEKLRRYRFAFPPPDEQAWIVRHIDGCLERIDQSIDRAKRQIALMREYRTRLIADVVTGKLDVREAAANLPDEPEDLEPIEQGDTLSESGSEDDRAESEGTIEDGP